MVKGEFTTKESKESLVKSYILKEVIESGTTSHVYEAIDTRSKKTVAIKVISRKRYVGIEKKEIREDRILREALVSYLLTHKHIVSLREFFYTDEYFYLVFDYVKGEQLLKKIVRNRKLSESLARKYFKQILSALSYCHSHHLVHRDIKIENILIDRNDNAVLIDFGLCNFFEKDGYLGTFCGSLYFAAPELLSGSLYEGPEVDIWSLGVVLYVMVCGKVPFDDKSMHLLYKKIMDGAISLDGVSNNVASLLKQMLEPDRRARITISEIYKHPWIGGEEEKVNKMKAYITPERAAYIDYLFGGRFKKKETIYPNALFSIARLMQGRVHGRIANNRIDAISELICDRKLRVKRTVLSHWKGMCKEETAMVSLLERTLGELGLVFELSAGKYYCSTDKVCFALQIVQNILSRAYSVEIRGKERKCAQIREIEKQIKKQIRQYSI